MILIWLLHALYSTALADLLAIVFGGLNGWIAFVSLAVGSALAIRHARRFSAVFPELKWGSFDKSSAGTMEILLFAFILYAGTRHFVYLFYNVEHGWSTLSTFNFGDLPLHINYIRMFANGLPFPPHNPEFASELLHYPFGPDLYNALFEVLGVKMQAHLALVGIAALSASLVFLRAFAGWWGIGAFFLNGGLSGWNYLSTWQLQNNQQKVEWKNLLLTVFITQRGMLFALPAGLFLLLSVQRHFAKTHHLTRAQMTVVGLVWAILPLFHLHAFIVVSIMMLGFAVVHQGMPGALAFFRSRMALIAYLPATAQILTATEFGKKASIVNWHRGWMSHGDNVIQFLIYNFGFWLLLPALIAVGIRMKGNRTGERQGALWIEFGLNLLLFVLFFNVMLAPWPWDNIKVLIWPYLGFARLAWLVIEPYFQERPSGYVFRGIAACALFFTGFTIVLWSVQSPSATAAQIYHTSELANAEGALTFVPKSAVFAAATTHDHVLTYFGRVRAEGYEGHIWSHGIDASKVGPMLTSLMRGEGDWLTTAHELGVNYIYWGPQEAAVYGSGAKPWMSVLKNVSRVPGHAVYLVN